MELQEYSKKAKIQLRHWLEGFSLDDVYFNSSKAGEWGIKGRRCSAFVFAHAAFKIKSVADLEIDGMKLEGLVKRAIGLTISNFVGNYTSTYDKNQTAERAAHLLKIIPIKYGQRLSLFGLIHCLDLLSACEPPCDIPMERGYSPQIVERAFNQYASHCKKEYEAFMQKIEMQEYDKRMEELKKDPATRQAVKTTMEKFAATFAEKFKEEPAPIKSRYEGHPQREWAKTVSAEEMEQVELDQMMYARRMFAQQFGEDAEIDFG